MIGRMQQVVAAGAALILATTLAACGSGGSGGTSSAGNGSASGSSSGSAVTLAKGASSLCKTIPSDPTMVAKLDHDDVTAVDTSYVGLQAVNANAANDDGPFVAGTVGGRQAITPTPGTSSATGEDFDYVETYFATGGAIDSSVSNVELCLEVYDGVAGQEIHLDYSGNNTDGPVNGAYDAAPEIYLTTGSKKWITLAFSMTDINFQSGAAGSGGENYGTDFRVSLDPPLQQGIAYDQAWLITKNVPATQSLAKAADVSTGVKIA